MIKRFLQGVREALFPENFTCELCGVEIFEDRLCPDCARTVFHNDGVTCPVCGRRMDESELCADCKEHIPNYEKGVSALVYEGGAIALVGAYKRGKAYLKRYFADLIEPLLANLPAYDEIAYIPITKAKKRERGYNQSLLLAKELSKRTGKPVLHVLEKAKDTPEQKTLSRQERLNNLENCFRVTDRAACKGKSILLVDDVLTTGATVEAAAKKLKQAGAKAVYVACVASVEYEQFAPVIMG